VAGGSTLTAGAKLLIANTRLSKGRFAVWTEKVAHTSSRGSNTRLYLLGGILLFWFFAICLRLVYLQIFRYGEFEQRAERQQLRTIDVSPRRGIIYDRAGRELAMSISVDSAFAVPSEIPDLGGTSA
jgi:cell division protein FtsI/penicillin-binding protein 2